MNNVNLILVVSVIWIFKSGNVFIFVNICKKNVYFNILILK